MMLIYIAGPFRGATPWAVAENVRAAERVGLAVVRRGHFPVIPHANSAHFDGHGSDRFWLDGTLELMRRCDAVLMMPKWLKSTGARNEHSEATRLGMKIFYAIGDVPRERKR